MTTPTNYIATWFYKESKEDASFYPQAGKRGDSAQLHSLLEEHISPVWRGILLRIVHRKYQYMHLSFIFRRRMV